MTLTRSESEELFQSSEKLIGAMLGQNNAQAYVVIHSDRGEEYGILKDISHLPEVKEADVVFGYYDVICKVEAPDNKRLENVITKAIRSRITSYNVCYTKLLRDQNIFKRFYHSFSS